MNLTRVSSSTSRAPGVFQEKPNLGLQDEGASFDSVMDGTLGLEEEQGASGERIPGHHSGGLDAEEGETGRSDVDADTASARGEEGPLNESPVVEDGDGPALRESSEEDDAVPPTSTGGTILETSDLEPSPPWYEGMMAGLPGNVESTGLPISSVSGERMAGAWISGTRGVETSQQTLLGGGTLPGMPDVIKQADGDSSLTGVPRGMLDGGGITGGWTEQSAQPAHATGRAGVGSLNSWPAGSISPVGELGQSYRESAEGLPSFPPTGTPTDGDDLALGNPIRNSGVMRLGGIGVQEMGGVQVPSDTSASSGFPKVAGSTEGVDPLTKSGEQYGAVGNARLKGQVPQAYQAAIRHFTGKLEKPETFGQQARDLHLSEAGPGVDGSDATLQVMDEAAERAGERLGGWGSVRSVDHASAGIHPSSSGDTQQTVVGGVTDSKSQNGGKFFQGGAGGSDGGPGHQSNSGNERLAAGGGRTADFQQELTGRVASLVRPGLVRGADTLWVGRIRVAIEKAMENSDQLGRRAVVELNDPELGRIRLDISNDSGRIKLDMWVEQDTSRQLLKDNRHALEQELARQKLHLEKFSVGGRAAGGEGQAGGGRDSLRGRRRVVHVDGGTTRGSSPAIGHNGQLDVIA